MSLPLAVMVAAELRAPPPAHATLMAAYLAGRFPGAQAVLFYGSVLRTGDLDGVMDFYVLTDAVRPGLAGLPSRFLWPDVSYHELPAEGGRTYRAKVAAMTLSAFRTAVAGERADTTIWTRFVQPSALVWAITPEVGQAVIASVATAVRTAARFAAVLGPRKGTADAFWRALFRQTYAAEFRVEARGREASILEVAPARYDAFLPAAWAADGIAWGLADGELAPDLPAADRQRILSAWRLRRGLGKPLNVARLVKAAFTFEGAARYAAWKIERHTGLKVPLTPWRERHVILASPGVLWRLWVSRRRGSARR